MKSKKIRIGEKNITNEGYEVIIIDYINSKNVVVRFNDSKNNEITTQYIQFKTGEIKNPFHKIYFDVGYIGKGSHIVSIDGKCTKKFLTWKSMIERCYSKEYHTKNPTYVGCIVDEEWHNFQNFGDWYDKNYYEI